jgi:hypothetical protein
MGSPMTPSMAVTVLFVAWGVASAILFVILIYRATLSSKEDDQIFIGAAEQMHGSDQREILARMRRLRAPIIALTAISVGLFISAISVWIYHGLNS